MKKILNLTLLTLSLGMSSAGYTKALAQDDHNTTTTMRDVLGSDSYARFSNDYDFYFDSMNHKVIYYISKHGGISTYRGLPKLSIQAITPRNRVIRKIFDGEKSLKIAGTFQSIPNGNSHKEMIQQAASNGYTFIPMTATNVEVDFVIESSNIGANGYPLVTCEEVELASGAVISIEGGEFDVPNVECFFQRKNENGQYESDGIEVPILYKAYVSRLRGGGSTNRTLDFSVEYLPDNAIIEDFKAEQYSGGNSQAIKARMSWDLDLAHQGQQARINIDWHKTVKSFSTFAALHNFACIDIQIRKHVGKVIEEGGITVDMFNPATRRWETYRHTSTELGKAVEQRVMDIVTSNMMTEIQAKANKATQSQIGVADGSNSKAIFTFHANYEKLLFKRNETYSVIVHPENEKGVGETSMDLSCVEGGFGSRITWSSACDI
jgi:hypothetical protein